MIVENIININKKLQQHSKRIQQSKYMPFFNFIQFREPENCVCENKKICLIYKIIRKLNKDVKTKSRSQVKLKYQV